MVDQSAEQAGGGPRAAQSDHLARAVEKVIDEGKWIAHGAASVRCRAGILPGTLLYPGICSPQVQCELLSYIPVLTAAGVTCGAGAARRLPQTRWPTSRATAKRIMSTLMFCDSVMWSCGMPTMSVSFRRASFTNRWTA